MGRVTRAVTSLRGGAIEWSDVTGSTVIPQARTAPTNYTRELRTLTEDERALKEEDWVLAGAKGAATLLGINRWTPEFRMGKLGIVRPDVVWIGA